MSEYPFIAFTALLIMGFGLFSRLAERSPITAPMIFVAVGIMVSPVGLSLLEVNIDTVLVRVIAEITLVTILFVDASTIALRSLIREQALPARLLAIGLPLTMLAGSLVTLLLFDEMSVWLIVMMACILSPTDAALGLAIINSKKVPEKIRQTINVESGLNDGIALPPILVCIAALAVAHDTPLNIQHWAGFTVEQLVFGPLIGGLVGWTGGFCVDKASQAGWMNATFQRLVAGSLAILAYGLAETVDGNGFIAAFFGGLLLGVRTEIVRERIQEFGEAEGQLLSLFVFLLFGSIMVPEALPYWDAKAWGYALLSLTIVRMAPVAISLLGTNLDWQTILFIGWCGPRGIASVLYVLIVVLEIGLPGHEYALSVIVLTVLLSVVLHGISAMPLARLYGARAMNLESLNGQIKTS